MCNTECKIAKNYFSSIPDAVLLFCLFTNLTTADLSNLAKVNKKLHELLVRKYDLYFRCSLPLRLSRIQNDFNTWIHFDNDLMTAAHKREAENLALFKLFFLELGMGEFILWLPPIRSHAEFSVDLILVISLIVMCFVFKWGNDHYSSHQQTLGNYLATTSNHAHKSALEKLLKAKTNKFTQTFWKTKIANQNLLDFILDFRNIIISGIDNVTNDNINAGNNFALIKDGTLYKYLQHTVSVLQNLKEIISNRNIYYHRCNFLQKTLDNCIARLQTVLDDYTKNHPEQKLIALESFSTSCSSSAVLSVSSSSMQSS